MAISSYSTPFLGGISSFQKHNNSHLIMSPELLEATPEFSILESLNNNNGKKATSGNIASMSAVELNAITKLGKSPEGRKNSLKRRRFSELTRNFFCTEPECARRYNAWRSLQHHYRVDHGQQRRLSQYRDMLQIRGYKLTSDNDVVYTGNDDVNAAPFRQNSGNDHSGSDSGSSPLTKFDESRDLFSPEFVSESVDDFFGDFQSLPLLNLDDIERALEYTVDESCEPTTTATVAHHQESSRSITSMNMSPLLQQQASSTDYNHTQVHHMTSPSFEHVRPPTTNAPPFASVPAFSMSQTSLGLYHNGNYRTTNTIRSQQQFQPMLNAMLPNELFSLDSFFGDFAINSTHHQPQSLQTDSSMMTR